MLFPITEAASVTTRITTLTEPRYPLFCDTMWEVPGMRILYVHTTQYWNFHKLKFQVTAKRSGRLGRRYKTDEYITGRGSVLMTLGLLHSTDTDLMRSVERYIL
jgi:hypothetical protein